MVLGEDKLNFLTNLKETSKSKQEWKSVIKKKERIIKVNNRIGWKDLYQL